jgi:F-type H+-transporting ATPase subunit c
MDNAIQLISIFAAAMAVSFGAIGPALGEGRAVASAMDAIARQPDSAGTVSRTLFVGLKRWQFTLWSSRCSCSSPIHS